jgi:hypothetical protein
VASQRLPFRVLSLPAGVVVDRVRKRPVMIGCNVARTLILVSIPILSAGALRLWHLFAASIAIGVFTVFFDLAYLSSPPGEPVHLRGHRGDAGHRARRCGSHHGLHRRRRDRPLCRHPLAVFLPPAALLFPLFMVIGAIATAGNVAQMTLRQSLSPASLQGRMSSVFRSFFWGAWPLGNPLGGVLAAAIGATTTLWLTALLGTIASMSHRVHAAVAGA